MENLKESILKLRKEGYSYRQIVKTLNCSISLVSYYCGEGQKEKNINRARKARENNVIQAKLFRFKSKKKEIHIEEPRKDDRNFLAEKCRDFQRREQSKYTPKANLVFRYDDVLEIYGEETRCYLTGRLLDLKNPKCYEFDHIVPAIRGGDNSFDNLGIACKQVNKAKSNMTKEEFIQLCKEVLTWNGFEIKEA